jgi:hypothetical protein
MNNLLFLGVIGVGSYLVYKAITDDDTPTDNTESESEETGGAEDAKTLIVPDTSTGNLNSDALERSKKLISIYAANKNLCVYLLPRYSNKQLNGRFSCYEFEYDTTTKQIGKLVGNLYVSDGKRTRDGGVPIQYLPKYNALLIRINVDGKYRYVAITPRYVDFANC